MRINITPVDVEGITCTEAEVQASLSTSVAIRIIPVDAEGTEHPDAVFGVVGGATDPDVQDLLTAVGSAIGEFIAGRGY